VKLTKDYTRIAQGREKMNKDAALSGLTQVQEYLKTGHWPNEMPPERLRKLENAAQEAGDCNFTVVFIKYLVELAETLSNPYAGAPPNRINIKEFMDFGFLHECNRKFLHPLGLALEVTTEENGTVYISGVWDYRDDPEGINFSEETLDPEKVERVEKVFKDRSDKRQELLGYVIQPMPQIQTDTDSVKE